MEATGRATTGFYCRGYHLNVRGTKASIVATTALAVGTVVKFEPCSTK